MQLARRLVQQLPGAVISSWPQIVLAIALLLMSVVLLACNSSPTGNGLTGSACIPPPSVPTATPKQRFKVDQQINVNNMYVVSLKVGEARTQRVGLFLTFSCQW